MIRIFIAIIKLYSLHKTSPLKNLFETPAISDFDIELSSKSSLNSFLVEIDVNNDINKSWREEINRRFKSSKVNKRYRFPRKKTNLLKSNINKDKASISRRQGYFGENKMNRSLSPYEIYSSKITKNASTMRSGTIMLSKTPAPIKIKQPVKTQSKLPQIIKSSIDKQKDNRIQSYYIGRKQSP